MSDATDVNVIERLPDLVVVTGASGVGSWNNDTNVWHIDSVANGTGASLLLTVRVIGNGSVANSVVVTSKENDTEVMADADPVIVDPDVRLSITKVVVGDVTAVYVGDSIVYNITVVNNGLSDATDVNVIERLPDLVVVTGDSGVGSWNNDTNVWHIDSVANGTGASLLLTVEVIHAGSVSNTVSVNCSENATETTVNSSNVTANKVNSTLDLGDDVVFDYGGSGNTTVCVTGGTVSVDDIAVVGHPEANVTLSNGVITVSGLDAGNYTLNVTTVPDENHISVSGSVAVIVNKVNSTLDLGDDVVFDYGGSGNTTVCVSGGTVSVDDIVVVGHPEANVTLNNGVITVSGLDAGNYTLSVTTTPDVNHEAVNGTVNVVVNKVNSTLDLGDDVVFDYGGSGNTTVSVSGGSLSVDNITVIDHPEAVISLEDGIITVSGLDVGNYTLNVTTDPDCNHESVSKTVDITVNKVALIFNADGNPIYFYIGETSTLVGHVNVSDARGTVTFLDNESRFIAEVPLLGSNGELLSATLNDVLKSQHSVSVIYKPLKTGIHNITAIYSGDDRYLGATDYIILTVYKLTPEMDVNATENPIVGDEVTVHVELSQNATGNITYINGDEKVTLPVGHDYKFTPQEEGDYNITAIYSGDDKYESKSDSVVVPVGKVKSNINVFADDIKVGEDAIIKISVPDDATGNITVKIAGRTIKTKAIKGYAVLSVSNLPAGDYFISVHLDEDEKYLSSDNDTDMGIIKIKPNLDVEVVHEGNKSTFITELPEDATGNVTFNIDGNKYTVPVIDGKATLILYNLVPGKYSVNATYSGDFKYEGNDGEGNLEFNDISKEPSKDIAEKINTKEYNKENKILEHETGNPIVMALIAILSAVVIPLRRRI